LRCPGTAYDYYITGTWDQNDSMQVCVSGGTITDTTAASGCTVRSFPLGEVIVIWNAGTSGSITVSSSKGNALINVSVTVPFQAGMLDSASKLQTVSPDSIPSSIICLIDSGGSCSPSYMHQWQQSSDAVDWVDMPGATSQNLSFSSPLAAPTYFRRKVTETGSGDIGYSDIAVVFVDIPYAREIDKQFKFFQNGFTNGSGSYALNRIIK